MSVEPRTWTSKDYHVHESHSADASSATVEGYCKMAEMRGIDEIAFTPHFIIKGPDTHIGPSPDELEGYVEEIHAAQEDTPITLRVGLEVDYFPGEERRIEAILEEHPLDFVLGSLHYIHGYDIGSRIGSREFFGGRGIEEALTIYYRGWGQAVESGLFDVMAHPDYFRRFLPETYPEGVTWEQYGDSVYSAIDSLASHGVGVSVNSSGWRHGIGDVFPVRGFLEATREAGVDVVTIGSDSHRVEGLGANTLRSAERLREAGYSHIYTYESRRGKKVPLEDVVA